MGNFTLLAVFFALLLYPASGNLQDSSVYLAMHKISNRQSNPAEAFYSANWCYARFTPQGDLSINAQKVAECHQCHSIAFQLTGDLTFTQLP
ncbi:MAG: cytochrome P460 family protein [Proteobacteria bacterium]|nr:cytochrome P460 family protein [Pseudomonadota bacterium]